MTQLHNIIKILYASDHYKVYGEIAYPFPNFKGATETLDSLSNFMSNSRDSTLTHWGPNKLDDIFTDIFKCINFTKISSRGNGPAQV